MYSVPLNRMGLFEAGCISKITIDLLSANPSWIRTSTRGSSWVSSQFSSSSFPTFTCRGRKTVPTICRVLSATPESVATWLSVQGGRVRQCRDIFTNFGGISFVVFELNPFRFAWQGDQFSYEILEFNLFHRRKPSPNDESLGAYVGTLGKYQGKYHWKTCVSLLTPASALPVLKTNKDSSLD
jgi:hypothetical protein